jgi:hypothetical protein
MSMMFRRQGMNVAEKRREEARKNCYGPSRRGAAGNDAS